MSMLTPVAALPATAPRYSLLTAAALAGDNGERWETGFAWTPESCGAGGIHPADCSVQAERDVPASSPITEGRPVYLWAADECSTLGFHARDWQGRARRQLEATQSHQLAAELWTGALTTVEHIGSENTYLADDGVVVGTLPTEGLPWAALEAWALACRQGGRSMIHVSPFAFAWLVSSSGDYIDVAGSVAVTRAGTIIVTDSGYPGTPPDSEADDGDEWAFVTPVVQVRLGAVELLPETLADARNLASAIDLPSNHVTVWAQRLAAYQLDPCCRYAASLGITRPTTPTPAS